MIEPIAHIRTGFDEKFGVPRQSGLAPNCCGTIVFEPRYRDPEALRGLEGFDYLWIIWEFSLNGARWQPTVRPPRLGGNKRMGVFATRSTFRPNPIGLSSVRIEKVISDSPDGPVVVVSGVDLVDGTPVFDIKPYISYADSHPDAACGWVDEAPERDLEVKWENPGQWTDEQREELGQILALDPRPSYIDNADRIFGISYKGQNVRFTVNGKMLTVLSGK